MNKFDDIIKKCNKFVSKCRMSTIIAVELKKLNKKVLKNVVTRWNSIYIMIQSINKLTDTEMADLVSKIDKKDRPLFTFKKEEKKTLIELEKTRYYFLRNKDV